MLFGWKNGGGTQASCCFVKHESVSLTKAVSYIGQGYARTIQVGSNTVQEWGLPICKECRFLERKREENRKQKKN